MEQESKRIWKKIYEKREALGLRSVNSSVQSWWMSFELCNQDYPTELLRILETMEANSANLHELWLSYTFCIEQDVQSVLDYLVMKKKNLPEKRELVVSDFIDSIGIPLVLQ